MNRYKNLFDTVSKIVNENGKGILSEPRFWGMLTDYYPFSHESKLKDVYKDCISFGWVSAVGSLPADKGKVDEFIAGIIETNPQDVREELAVTLFSVAIAVGKCTEADYRSFINRASRSSNSQSTTKGQSPSNTQSRRNVNQSKIKGNGNNTLWYVILAAAVVMAFLLINKSCRHKEIIKTEVANEYETKVRENEERGKKRENYDSTLSVKNIELGSDYERAVRYMKSSKDYKDSQESYYVLDNSDRYHPVYQLMNKKLRMMPKWMAENNAGDYKVIGKVYSSKMVLDTIPMRLYVCELNGKVTFIIIEGINMPGGSHGKAFTIDSYRKSYPYLLELYYEKYHLPERRTYDGMPYNPEKEYMPKIDIYASDENDVWTFSKGKIRMSSKRILYATTDFLDSITVQYERARIESAKEDSLRRINNHENALKAI